MISFLVIVVILTLGGADEKLDKAEAARRK